MPYNVLLRKSGDRRVLDIPSNEEKRRQRLLLSYLAPQLESLFSDYSYGFRKGRSSKDAVDAFRKNVDDGHQWITYMDIEDCFDSIDPPTALGLIDNRIGDYYPDQVTGLPQGHPLSPLLCNVFLDQFDKKMERHVLPSQIRDFDFRFLRYVDDIWLMARNKKALELYTSRAVRVLEDFGFKSRVQIRHVNEGVDVLGFSVRRWSICPSTKSLNRLHDRLIHLLCRHLEMNNETGHDYNTNAHAINRDTTQQLQEQYQHLKTGWVNYYGHDTYTKAIEQWLTLVTWITMIEESGVISSQTHDTSPEYNQDPQTFHIHSHARNLLLMIKRFAYALTSFVNTVKRWLNSSLYILFSVKRSDDALSKLYRLYGGETKSE